MQAKVIVSAVAGFLFGAIIYLILLLIGIGPAFKLAATSGLFFALLLFPTLVVYGKMIEKRYAKFEKEITSPIFCKINGNFDLGNGKVKNGNIYFCEAGIVCVCLDEKPYTADEIPLQDIDRYQADQVHLNIFTKDGRVFVITTPNVNEIINALTKKGWIRQ